MRYIYVLWAVAIVIWVVLAVLSDDPRVKWMSAVATTLFAVGALIAWRNSQKKGPRRSKDVV